MGRKSIYKVFSTGMTPASISLKLSAEGRSIHGEWKARQQQIRDSAAQKWDEGPDDWLVRRIYALVRHLLSIGARRRFLQWVKDRVAFEGGGDISDHPYKMALLVFAGQPMNATSPAPFSRQRRHLLGDALAYAALHEVSAKHVNGFIKQAKLKECRKKLAAGHREPGFTRERKPVL